MLLLWPLTSYMPTTKTVLISSFVVIFTCLLRAKISLLKNRFTVWCYNIQMIRIFYRNNRASPLQGLSILLHHFLYNGTLKILLRLAMLISATEVQTKNAIYWSDKWWNVKWLGEQRAVIRCFCGPPISSENLSVCESWLTGTTWGREAWSAKILDCDEVNICILFVLKLIESTVCLLKF